MTEREVVRKVRNSGLVIINVLFIAIVSAWSICGFSEETVSLSDVLPEGLVTAKPAIFSFEEVPKLLEKCDPLTTIVFLDVDDLVICPKQSIGMLRSRNFFLEALIGNQIQPEFARHIAHSVWEYALLSCTFFPAESACIEAVKFIQNRKLPLLGVSRRSGGFASLFPSELMAKGIDFYSSLPEFLKLHYFLSPKDPKAVIAYGILFMGESSAADVFSHMRHAVSIPLKKVVCFSSHVAFLFECKDFFETIKAEYSLYLMENRLPQDFNTVALSKQLMSLRAIAADKDFLSENELENTDLLENQSLILKLKEIWELCSG